MASAGNLQSLTMVLCRLCAQEDDEFEEFEQQEWTASHEDAEDPAMWQDGWEDDEDDDQFTSALRAELALSEGAVPPANPLLHPTASNAMQQ